MRDPQSRVITKFDLPAALPKPVAAAEATFTDLAAKLAEARQKAVASEEQIEQARRADLEAAGKLMADGKAESPDPHRREREAREAAQKLKDEIATLEAAVDIAGDRLIEAIAEAREQWLVDLQAEVDEAREEFTEAIERAGASLNALSGPSEVLPWLSDFAPWKVTSKAGNVRLTAEFSGQLKPEIARAFSGLASLGAAARAPESMAA